MQELVNRDTFHICGYTVETTAAQNDRDVSGLYEDFFDTGKEEILLSLRGSRKGYYGLSWYTQGRERYCYLLGVEVDKENVPPDNAMLKTLEQTTYAVAYYRRGKDILKAWTEFFFTDIPAKGYTPNEKYNLYFEYYPEDVHGDYELWVPVISG